MAVNIKPEGWECHGPCHQGRAKCPTPHACERPDDDEGTLRLLGQAFLAVILAALVVVCLGVLL
jgi:hypothetical protein